MSADVPGSGSSQSATSAPGSVHRILRNSMFNLAGQVLYIVLQVLVLGVLARVLGKEGLGNYYLLVSLIVVLQLTLEAGIGTILTRRITQSPDTWKETAAEAAGLFSIIALFSAAVLLAIGTTWAWLENDFAILLSCAAAAFVCAANQVQRFCIGVFQAFEMFGYENLVKVVRGVIFVGLVIALAMQKQARTETVMAMLALSHGFAVVVLLIALYRRWRFVGWRLNFGIVVNWFSEAVPLGLGDVVRGITWQLDSILLGLLQPAAVLGIYSVAYRPLRPLNWLPRAVLTAAFPSFSRLATVDRESLDSAFSNSLRLLWIVSLPIAISICICAEPLIIVLAGNEFVEAAVPMRILIWISVLSFLSIQFRYFLVAIGCQHVFARLVLWVLFLEVGVELVLIPRWGYFGACAGSLMGELVFTVAGLVVCRRMGSAGIKFDSLVRTALAGCVMGAALWFARDAAIPLLAGAVVISTVLYFILCVLLGSLQRDEVWRVYASLRQVLKTDRDRRGTN